MPSKRASLSLASIKKIEGLLRRDSISPVDLASIIADLREVPHSSHKQLGPKLKVRAIAALAHARLRQKRTTPTDDSDDVIKLLNATLNLCYKLHSTIDDVERSKIRLLLALAYDLRTTGIRSEHIGRVAELTDSLDLQHDDYYWPLSRILRAKAYRDRSQSQSMPMDNLIAFGFLEEAIKRLKKVRSRELLAEANLEMGKTVLLMPVLSDGGEPCSVAESYLSKALKFFAAVGRNSRLAEAQLGLGKVYFRRYHEQGGSPNAERALELFNEARMHSALPTDAKILAEIELFSARLYRLDGPFYSEEKASAAFEAGIAAIQQSTDREDELQQLAEYGMTLFSRRLWPRAAEVLSLAIFAAENILDEAASLDSRREAVRPLSVLTTSLAYCQMMSSNFVQAFLCIERGKARLLSESFRLSGTEMPALNPNPSKSQALSRVPHKIRELEAEQYGGLHDPRDNKQIANLRRKLRSSVNGEAADERSVATTVKDLSPSDPDEALVVSMLTIHGGAVFVLQHGESAITDANVIRIPELSTEKLRRWLTEDGALSKSWFGADADRTKSLAHQRRWMATIEIFCKRLGDVIIKQLCDKLKRLGIRSIVIVPGGGLQFLPLSACSTDNSGHCLLDDFSVTLAPSAYAARVCAQRRRERKTTGNCYFLAGVSRYEDAPDLPYVKTEIEVLGHLLRAPTRLDNKITPKVFAKAAVNSSVVHLACHGIPWSSGGTMFRYSWAPEPVLRFAKDGLTFRDILRVPLDQTMLVTLSSCDSGAIDQTLAWDELEGLPHVFLQAGAANVVSSIWSVNDRSTSLLMMRFYSNLTLDEQSPAHALREAQLWLRDATRQSLSELLKPAAEAGIASAVEMYSDLILGDQGDKPYAHPYYWAAFNVTGG